LGICPFHDVFLYWVWAISNYFNQEEVRLPDCFTEDGQINNDVVF